MSETNKIENKVVMLQIILSKSKFLNKAREKKENCENLKFQLKYNQYNKVWYCKQKIYKVFIFEKFLWEIWNFNGNIKK